jgi:hypothetical protein
VLPQANLDITEKYVSTHKRKFRESVLLESEISSLTKIKCFKNVFTVTTEAEAE